MYKVDDWVKIIDKKTGNIIGAGQVKQRKDRFDDQSQNIHITMSIISLDAKWFFNENKTENFSIVNNPEHLIIEFKEENIPNTYIKLPFKIVDEYDGNGDVYRDWGIDELDIEVKDLVTVLNLFDGMHTIGSCCGHGEDPLWVDIQFSNIKLLGMLCKIISTKFTYDFILTTHYGLINTNISHPIFKLQTAALGEEAYKKAKELTKELEKWKLVLH